jgi:hypothetical protein
MEAQEEIVLEGIFGDFLVAYCSSPIADLI